MSRLPLSASRMWVVIPAHNEGATVRDVAVRALRYCPNVIVVDDGSTDATIEALTDVNITLLINEKNRGKADSLWRGFQEALAHGASAVLTLDADGQHAPEEIPAFMAAATGDPEAFLIGARHSEQRKRARWRYIANRVADFWISWAAGRPIEDTQSGFRLYPARFLRTLTVKHGLKESFVFESEVLIEAGRRGGALPACSDPRRAADWSPAQPFPPGLGHCKNYRDGGNETAPQRVVSARPLPVIGRPVLPAGDE